MKRRMPVEARRDDCTSCIFGDTMMRGCLWHAWFVSGTAGSSEGRSTDEAPPSDGWALAGDRRSSVWRDRMNDCSDTSSIRHRRPFETIEGEHAWRVFVQAERFLSLFVYDILSLYSLLWISMYDRSATGFPYDLLSAARTGDPLVRLIYMSLTLIILSLVHEGTIKAQATSFQTRTAAERTTIPGIATQAYQCVRRPCLSPSESVFAITGAV